MGQLQDDDAKANGERGGDSSVVISKRLVAINSASSLLRFIFNVTVLVWLQQYLLKRISPQEYSLLPVVWAIMAFLPLATIVLTSGVGRYIIEAASRGDDKRVTEIVSTITPFLLACAAIIGLGGAGLIWKIGPILSIDPPRIPEARLMLGLVLLSFALGTVATPFCVGINVRQKFILQDLIDTGGDFLRIALLFILLLGVSTRVLWVAVAVVATRTLVLGVKWVISRRLVPALRFRISYFRKSLARELLSFGGWSFLGQMAQLIRRNVDVIVLQKLAAAHDVAAFHLGSMAEREIRQITAQATSRVQPALIAMHAQERSQALQNAFLRGGRMQLWLAMLFATPLIVLREELFQIYLGNRYGLYQAAAPVMAMLLGTLIISSGRGWHDKVAMATGRIRRLMVWLTLMQGTNLLLTLFLVGYLKFGALGSALSTLSVAVVFQFAVLWPMALHDMKVTFRDFLGRTIMPGLLPTAGTAVLLELARVTLHPTTIWPVVAAAMGGMAIYCTLVIVFAMQREDRRDLGRVFDSLKSR